MTWACESTMHEGERIIRAPSDRYELRLELRRITDQGRERVRLLIHICRACARFYFDETDPALDQLGLLTGTSSW